MTVQFNPKTGGRGIEWTDITRNPIGGCLHDCKWKMPDGTIAMCYAKELADSGVAKKAYPNGFEHHYWRGEKSLRELASGNDPRLIFCDSMSDLFASNVPREQVMAILATIASAPHHTYQSLTKAAPGILKYIDFLPPNLWVGVSSPPDFFRGHELTGTQKEAMLRRSLEVLWRVKSLKGNIVWMSAEPVSWDLTTVLGPSHPLDWCVVGAASRGRRTFQPRPEYVRKLLDGFDSTRTPVFFKGNIRGLFKSHNLGSDELNRWREDFPIRYRDGSFIQSVIARQHACVKHGWTQSRGIDQLPAIDPVPERPSCRSLPILDTQP